MKKTITTAFVLVLFSHVPLLWAATDNASGQKATVAELQAASDARVAADTLLQGQITEISETPGPKGEVGLRGQKGPEGEFGADGAKGPIGPDGESGAKGERGPMGDLGAVPDITELTAELVQLERRLENHLFVNEFPTCDPILPLGATSNLIAAVWTTECGSRSSCPSGFAEYTAALEQVTQECNSIRQSEFTSQNPTAGLQCANELEFESPVMVEYGGTARLSTSTRGCAYFSRRLTCRTAAVCSY